MKLDFREWLISQVNRGDPIGELASRVAHDSCIPAAATGYPGIKHHLITKHGIDQYGENALRLAGKEWAVSDQRQILTPVQAR